MQDWIHDHTYVLTTDHLFFCLAGESHTTSFLFGMLYYVPTVDLAEKLGRPVPGKFQYAREWYSKVLDVTSYSEYPSFIREHYPAFYYSPPTWRSLMRMDRNTLKLVFDPRSFVRSKYPRVIGQSVATLIDEISTMAPGLHGNLGVTGSLLLGSEVSSVRDIDLVVYGRSNVPLVRDMLLDANRRSNSKLASLNQAALHRYVDSRRQKFPGTYEQLFQMTLRRWDLASFGSLRVDFSFVDTEATKVIDYDAPVIGVQTISTVVESASEAAFLPTLLYVTDSEISQILVTARGYICLFQAGDRILARGTVHLNVFDQPILVVDDLNGGFVVLADT